MLQVDAMLPCIDVQLVFQFASNELCTRGHGRRGELTESVDYFVLSIMADLGKACDT